MIFKDERGSALVTVLIMVTALTVISGSILAAFTLHYRFARRDLNRLQAFYFAEAGIYKALWYISGHDGFDWNWRPENEEIFVSNNQTAQISIQERGGFLEIISSIRFNNQNQKLRVLVGQNMPDEFNQAIIIGGADFPLVVTGSNRIIGDVTVGSGGVKPGTIKGIKFSGEKLVDGRIHRISPPQMPYFDAKVFLRSMQKFKELLQNPPETISNNFFDSDSLRNSSETKILYVQGKVDFHVLGDSLLNGPITIVSDGDVFLSGSIKLMNQVYIVAKGEISVTDSVLLDDAVVYSEKGISVSGNVKGAMQLLTIGDIQVSGHSQLEYPSVLFTTGHVVENKRIGTIKIEDDAEITGAVILMDTQSDSDKNVRRDGKVVVESNAQVTGLIYSTNHTTIRGRVHGLVAADHFYLYESPTTYINWLKDAYINRKNLGAGFKLPLLFTDKPNLEIVTW